MSKQILISDTYGVGAIIIQDSVQKIVVSHLKYQIGDIYYGSVYKVFPSINAAFININKNAHYNNGFIHLHDLVYSKRQRINQQLYFDKIYNFIINKQKILVQIVKEPNLNKGPRLTMNWTVAGHYLTLMPYSNIIHVTKKIHCNDSRSFLLALGKLLQFNNIGIKFNEKADKISEHILIQEFFRLKEQLFYFFKQILSVKAPNLIHRNDNLISNCIRDYYSVDISEIMVDTSSSLHQMKFFLAYWQCILPVNKIQIRQYTNSNYLINSFNLSRIWSNLSRDNINLLTGGYLIIESFNAMTIIDVNSGGFSSLLNVKDAVLYTNLLAAKEIAYQLILRNISGIILIDFIDMINVRDKLLLLEYLNALFEKDYAKPQIVQFSELGIIEVTRKRVYQSLSVIYSVLQVSKIKFTDFNMMYILQVLSDNYECAHYYLE
uniref:ribonuclease E n=1 Tax=Erythrolobus coxiae TaxID=362235 RepID=UPI001FCD65AC|nr:ribonuclease E [Erythrolobus coxiae]UNJ17792.1 ribonuclease E [Erythrolobus coxiae]